MAYDKTLEARIETLTLSWPDLEKRRMFGGVCYLHRGNICFGIWKELLIVRTSPEQARLLLENDQVRPFDVTGRPMKGWVMVEPLAMASEESLGGWLVTGRDFAATLPPRLGGR